MGLLTIIRKTKLKEKQIRVLILGLDNAGKTTIVKRILGEDINEISPTLGFNIRTIIHSGFSLNVWDIGGQKSLRPYWRNYFEITDAVIWVIDSSDKERMIDCKLELKSLLLEEKLAGASLLILANKQDIPNSLTTTEIAIALELDQLTSHTYTVIPCSARLDSSTSTQIEGGSSSKRSGDERIWKGLDWVVKEVSRRVYYGAGGGNSDLNATDYLSRKKEGEVMEVA